jgi:hypothetical protein
MFFPLYLKNNPGYAIADFISSKINLASRSNGVKEKRECRQSRFGFKMEEGDGKKAWTSEEISSGGGLHKFQKSPIGSKIRLIFKLPGSTNYIEVVGEVTHSTDKGAGVEFITIDSEGKKNRGICKRVYQIRKIKHKLLKNFY